MTNVTMAAIAKAVNKPESTIYRWKKENPELFEAVREYAARIAQASEPTADKAYWEGRAAVGKGISDCPYTRTMTMTSHDKELADAWIEGLKDGESVA